jgi:predicted nucleic acid-binding Zn ribbon protein
MPPDPPADPPADGSGGTPGVDLARAALAAARAQARRSGRAPRRAGAGRDGPSRSGPAADERDPQPLARTIDRLLTERGWEVPAAVAGVMSRWEQIVGAELAAHCRPESFTDGRLVLSADSTAWATQVRLLTPALLRRLGEELGGETVREVTVLGPVAPSWKRGGRSVRGRGPRDTYG